MQTSMPGEDALAVLKTIGWPSGSRVTIAWQATVAAIIAAVPLGIALGRWLWVAPQITRWPNLPPWPGQWSS